MQSSFQQLGNGGKGPVNLLPGPIPLPIGQPGAPGPLGPYGSLGQYVSIVRLFINSILFVHETIAS